LKEDSVALVSNSLEVISTIALCGDKSTFLYHLLNKTNPPLLRLLNQLYNKQELMGFKQVRGPYINTCLTIASKVDYYHFEHLQNDRYELMCSNLKKLAQ
jgi:hypothetical protein